MTISKMYGTAVIFFDNYILNNLYLLNMILC